jgi:hypothetical protein
VGSYTYIAFRGEAGLYCTRLAGSVFSTETVELAGGGFRICLTYSTDTLHVGYIYQGNVRYAERDPSDITKPWG